MEHRSISTQNLTFPMPMVLVSADVDGEVNHMPVAWVTRTNYSPPIMGVAMAKHHHTNRGIHAHREFAISVPSQDLLASVDYVGLVSGTQENKSALFRIFRGALPHAPLVADCPLTMACRLLQVVDQPTHELFLGEVVELFCRGDLLVDGVPDVARMKPFTLTMPDDRYWAVGDHLGGAFSIGKALIGDPVRAR
jgi:flavin reductase (DIM6/NTAB) family NADH-FMN oxidoreductase RutF